MPSKGKQRASRQAQLRNKRRKGRTQVVASRRESTLESDSEEVIPPVKSASVTLPKQINTPKRAPDTSNTPGNNLTYEYLGGEIRQIGIVATVIVALLVAFTFIPLG